MRKKLVLFLAVLLVFTMTACSAEKLTDQEAMFADLLQEAARLTDPERTMEMEPRMLCEAGETEYAEIAEAYLERVKALYADAEMIEKCEDILAQKRAATPTRLERSVDVVHVSRRVESLKATESTAELTLTVVSAEKRIIEQEPGLFYCGFPQTEKTIRADFTRENDAWKLSGYEIVKSAVGDEAEGLAKTFSTYEAAYVYATQQMPRSSVLNFK